MKNGPFEHGVVAEHENVGDGDVQQEEAHDI